MVETDRAEMLDWTRSDCKMRPSSVSNAVGIEAGRRHINNWIDIGGVDIWRQGRRRIDAIFNRQTTRPESDARKNSKKIPNGRRVDSRSVANNSTIQLVNGQIGKNERSTSFYFYVTSLFYWFLLPFDSILWRYFQCQHVDGQSIFASTTSQVLNCGYFPLSTSERI